MKINTIKRLFAVILLLGSAAAYAGEEEYDVETIEDGQVTLSDGNQYQVSDSDDYHVGDQVVVATDDQDDPEMITNETNGVQDEQ